MIYLPTVNAVLNASSAMLLIVGYVCVRRGRIAAHKICMGLAFLVSTAFLASYLYYHFYAGVTVFQGQGWVRFTYFALLISHTILAVTIVPLVLVTLTLALRGRFSQHKRIARWTFPLWLYVSVTGVLVYLFLYHLYP